MIFSYSLKHFLSTSVADIVIYHGLFNRDILCIAFVAILLQKPLKANTTEKGSFHTSELANISKYKTMKQLDPAVTPVSILGNKSFFFFFLFFSPSASTSLIAPQQPGQPNGSKLSRTHLHLNQTDWENRSVSHTQLT